MTSANVVTAGPRSDEVPLPIAALRLREAYEATRARMFRGELQGRKIGVRWFVLEADVARVEAERPGVIARPA